MAPDDSITFFDLASKPPCKTWSLNPWKTRFVLNFKGLPYTTEWLEYPDIKSRLESHADANKSGAGYTSPTIALPDGTYIMDSREIANVLEKRQPEPALHLDSPYLTKLEAIMPRLMPALRGVYFSLIPARLLNEASLPYWYETRAKAAGMPLDQLAEHQGGAAAFAKAEPMLKEVTALLAEKSDGPFFMGKTVSYADFQWAGFLIFWRRIGEDQFAEILKATGDAAVHKQLLEAVEPWSRRDDH